MLEDTTNSQSKNPTESPPTDSKPGEYLNGAILDDHYQIVEKLGTGGMGIVWKANDLRLKKFVAVKSLLPHLVSQSLSLQRFQQEARAASHLNHTNVVSVHNFGVAPDGTPYIVMDYIEGVSLSQVIERQGPMAPDRAVKIFLQIADALQHAHAQGLIHRDLKPSNILLTISDNALDVVKIVDFGIAKLLPQDDSEGAHLTQTGEVFGSPLYMSPEQCQGEKLDVRSDIYQMGCLMYETLTGTHAVTGNNMLEILWKHVNETPKRSDDLINDISVPPQLEAIVFKCLAKIPSERYQSMQELKDALEKFFKESTGNLGAFFANLHIIGLRRRRFNRNEKIAAGVSGICLLAAIFFAVQLMNLYGSSSSSPLLKSHLTWQELTESPPSKPESFTTELSWARLYINKCQQLADVDKDRQYEILHKLDKIGTVSEHYQIWDTALDAYKMAAVIQEKMDVSQTIVGTLERANVARVYYEMSDYSKACEKYLPMISVMRQSHDAMQAEFIFANYRLANSYYFTGEKVNAIPYYSTAIMSWVRSDSTSSSEYAMSFSRLADCMLACPNHMEAWKEFKTRMPVAAESMRIQGKTELIPILNSNTPNECAMNCYKEAAARWALVKPLEEYDQSKKEELVKVAKINEAIADAGVAKCLSEDKKNSEADQAYETALKLLEDTCGVNDPKVGLLLRDYSTFLKGEGSYLKAFTTWQRALHIFAASK